MNVHISVYIYTYMCVCARVCTCMKCGVYLHSFLPFRSHFLVTVSSYFYIIYLCALSHIIYHIHVYNICIHKSTYRSEYGYLSFCIWLVLFNMMLSSSIHLVEWFYSLQPDTIPSCTSHIFLIHLYVVGCLDWFCILTIVNSAAVAMDVQVAVWNSGWNSFAYVPTGV